ncbi:S1C family serine protease [Streptomyces sp. B93]|uniref:S1C family serine protease n=1 Tax=Streptomyces sp. B93 TaxID=2824875 RepID=UPI001B36EE61|nr:trypsin-like peptidase domain-containing protein [Streptomyces sp. B93]MBQ1091774.1 trypsin-like peptidase domain-containing protein [Streptomyces sp. B93]
MSTENEGTEVPPAPSAPPVPVDTPAASPQAGDAPTPPPPGAGHEGSAPDANWPPPPAAYPPPAPQATTAEGGAQGGQQGDPYGGQHDSQHGGAQGGQYGGLYNDQQGSRHDDPHGNPYGNPHDPGQQPWGAAYHDPQATTPPPAKRSRGGRGGLLAAVLVAALVAGGLGGGIGYTLAKNDDGTSSTTVSAPDSGGDFKREPGTVAAVAAKALPSTVTIEAESSSGEGGTGTGFVFDTEGHIVTNNHVVADAVDGGKVSVTFPDGKKYDAEVVGNAQGYDVAVIKLDNAPSNLKPLTLGDSDKVAVGDSTIAIGAPFGLSNTVTTGIISAKNRPVASSDGSGSQASYMSALQTDASINPGNSGGPLLDAQGNVIGINSAIQSSGNGGFGTGQSGSIGLGFAIPINQAKYVAQELIKNGKPVYARIGASVSLEDTTDGAKITDTGAGGSEPVEPGGPADRAGLKPGDVITKLDDRVIDSGPTLIGEIWTHKPGDKVTLTYERNGKTNTVEVTLDSRVGDS